MVEAIEHNEGVSKLEKLFIGKSEVKGFIFRLQNANSRACIYEVQSNGQIHYEVFILKMHRRFKHLMYPKAKAFGKWAWSYYTLDQAIDKFNTL